MILARQITNGIATMTNVLSDTGKVHWGVTSVQIQERKGDHIHASP